MLEALREKGFEIQFESHAAAILGTDFPTALEELEAALSNFEIPIAEIIGSGGGETKGTQRMRHALNNLNWKKVHFEIKKTINGVERESVSHEVDHAKQFNGKIIALEIEWNNKDPFYDRDLENFKRLHAEGAISVGIVVTRGTSLQDRVWDFVYRFATEQSVDSFADLARLGIVPTPKQRAEIAKRVERQKNPVHFANAWTDNFVSNKYGEATTHWSKLMTRVSRGVGNPCPLLLIGLPSTIVTFDDRPIEVIEVEEGHS
jgi:hypothetical protein